IESQSLADRVLELFASSGALAGIRGLGITEAFTSRGLYELVGSSALAELETLKLMDGELARDQASELFAATPKLRVLELHRVGAIADLAEAIPTSVVELEVSCEVSGDLEALAASPVAAVLERLEIRGGSIDDARMFAAFPRLRSLS